MGTLKAPGHQRLEHLLGRGDAGDGQRALRACRGRRPTRLITLCLVGLPVSLKYCLASFQAVSTASPPPVVKKTRLRSPGASAARRSASSIGPGVGVGPQREEGELLGLLGGRLGELLAAVADLDDEQAGEPVDVLVAAVVPDLVALAADDDRHLAAALLVGRVAGEVHPQVVAGGLGVEVPCRRAESWRSRCGRVVIGYPSCSAAC